MDMTDLELIDLIDRQEDSSLSNLLPLFITQSNLSTMIKKLILAKYLNNAKYLDLDTDLSISTVRENVYYLRYSFEQSDSVVLASLEFFPTAIRLVGNKTETLLQESVKINSSCIVTIDEPSEAVQHLAITSNPDTINLIRNPKPAMVELADELKRERKFIPYRVREYEEMSKLVDEADQMKAVEKPWSFPYLKNPTEAVKRKALNEKGYFLNLINDPSEELIDVALHQDAFAIQYVKDKTEQHWMRAASSDGMVIRLHPNPPESVQVAAAKSDGLIIRYLPEQFERVQLAAIKQNPLCVFYLKDPTKKVQKLADKIRQTLLDKWRNPT